MKNLKKFIIMMMCAMMVFTAVPAMNSNAATKVITWQGNSSTAKFSGNKLIIQGKYKIKGKAYRGKKVLKLSPSCKYYGAEDGVLRRYSKSVMAQCLKNHLSYKAYMTTGKNGKIYKMVSDQ